MIPFERYELILKAVRKAKYISIKDLLDITQSSIATLRRDIDFLTTMGKIEKIRGCIVIVEKEEKEKLDDIAYLYNTRESLYSDEKEAIGIATQKYLEKNDIILLTYGTTTAQVAKHIDDKQHITVITNGIDIVNILQNKPNVEVIVLGGKVDYSDKVIKGPSTFKMLEDLHPSKVIMGSAGITEKGITGYDFLNSTFLTRVIDIIDKCIIVTDYSKFDRPGFVYIAPFDKIDIMVTDQGVPSKYIEIFRKHGIEHLIAPPKYL